MDAFSLRLRLRERREEAGDLRLRNRMPAWRYFYNVCTEQLDALWLCSLIRVSSLVWVSVRPASRHPFLHSYIIGLYIAITVAFQANVGRHIGGTSEANLPDKLCNRGGFLSHRIFECTWQTMFL